MKRRNGFTMIEVSLVLAIAGLILMMVFIALPGLQRSQRDAKRREDVLLVLEKIKDYQQSNRGALPTIGELEGEDGDGFRIKYLGGDNFKDPDGEIYTIKGIDCGSSNGCDNKSINSIKNGQEAHTMLVAIHATCNNQEIEKSSNPRKVAIMYRLEVGGVFCSNT